MSPGFLQTIGPPNQIKNKIWVDRHTNVIEKNLFPDQDYEPQEKQLQRRVCIFICDEIQIYSSYLPTFVLPVLQQFYLLTNCRLKNDWLCFPFFFLSRHFRNVGTTKIIYCTSVLCCVGKKNNIFSNKTLNEDKYTGKKNRREKWRDVCFIIWTETRRQETKQRSNISSSRVGDLCHHGM